MAWMRWTWVRPVVILMAVTGLGFGPCVCVPGGSRTSGDVPGTTATTTSSAPTTTGSDAAPPKSVRTGPVHNEGPHNGLQPCALHENAPLLEFLRRTKLSSEIMNAPQVQERLRSEDTRGLLKYVISCALDPTAEPVTADAALNGGLTGKYLPPWRGEMGLCGRTSPWHWGKDGPDEGCQEAVTACVLARVNKLGHRVVISMRGDPPVLFPTAPQVDVETYYREDSTNEIPSVRPCRAGSDTDCGYSPRHVGMCTSGPASSTGQSSPGTVTLTAPRGTIIRVCKGLYACTQKDENAGIHPHAGFLAEREDSVTFPCPSRDTRAPPGARATGYYSVLVKGGGVGNGDVRTDSANGAYPAPETAVFPFREGAFYGNLFDTATLAATMEETKVSCPADPKAKTAEKTMLMGSQFACYSEIWTDGAAHYTDRWCAGPSSNGGSCFGNEPVPCLFSPRSGGLAPDRACEGQTDGLEPYYPTCQSPHRTPGRWAHPITVYLNHPCDLSAKTLGCPGFQEDL